LGLTSGGSSSSDNITIPAFADGGFTGSNVPPSGMMALLHKNEWVFNTDQQKNLMGWVGGLAQTAMNAVTSMASQFVAPNISTITTNHSGNSSSSSMTLDIHDNIFQGTTKEQANQIFGIINNKLNQKGIKTK
jgi:hypothetical protein